MLKIEFQGFKPGVFTTIFGHLYEQVSAPPHPAVYSNSIYPAALEPIVRTMMRGQPYTFISGFGPPPAATYDDEHVMVGFSGGKDSTAVALMLAEMGFKPILMFVSGFNRSYPQELDAAVGIAKKTGFPLRIIRARLSGSSPYPDNPVKNQLILAMMVDYGLRTGIRNYAQGNLHEDKVANTNFETGFSDAIEMYDAAEQLFSQYVPGFRLHSRMIANETVSLEYMTRYPEIRPYISSCLLPLRYKPNVRRANERKFGPLLPGRCGSCYKCCQEYLVDAITGNEILSADHVKHCLAVFRKAWPNLFIPTNPPESDRLVLGKFLDGKRVDLDGVLRCL